jgi:hypothetical protein
MKKVNQVNQIKSAIAEEVIQDLINEIESEPDDSIALPIWKVMMRLREKYCPVNTTNFIEKYESAPQDKYGSYDPKKANFL